MPKSAKKRKAKAADFSKAKLKLGKGKQAPTNAVDTSFKARSITLPTQSIVVEKDAVVPTTKRKLTFGDLIAHTKHYSATTRKDAILGLRELLGVHWEILDSSLTTLINACVRIIADEDPGVRKVLLGFFAWILHRIPQEDLIPHSPVLLLFTASAQTHIFPEIRIDAIRFLDLLLDCIPQVVVTGWNENNNGHGARVLEGYLGVLNAGTKFGETDGQIKTTSSATVVLTSASKLIVLNSLSTFLERALSSTSLFCAPTSSSIDRSASINTWYLASSFIDAEAYQSFDELLQPFHQRSERHHNSRTWRAQVDSDDSDDDFPHQYTIPGFSNDDSQCNFHDLEDAVTESLDIDNYVGLDSTFLTHLVQTLHSTLVATFLDCTPAVFSPSTNPSDTDLQLVMAVARIVRSMYGAILQNIPIAAGYPNSALEGLEAILKYMAPYFPFKSGGSRDIKFEQAFQDLNLIFCELTSLLVLTAQSGFSSTIRPGKSRPNRQAQSNSKDALYTQNLRVSEYIIQLLRSESASASQLGRPLTPEAYLALLPTIWAYLNSSVKGNEETPSLVLQATVDHALKTSSKSAIKKLTIEFVARIVLLETESRYRGSFRPGRDAAEDQSFERWVTHLPQSLWELGVSNLPATETILRFLLRILQRKSSLAHAKTVMSLRSKLVPYFSITHAVRGHLPGPYTKLPSSFLRRLALDLVVTILIVGGRDLERDSNLSAAVDLAVAGTKEENYWAQLSAAGTS